jgi:hypothetical protein
MIFKNPVHSPAPDPTLSGAASLTHQRFRKSPVDKPFIFVDSSGNIGYHGVSFKTWWPFKIVRK